jgi:hypothetical protein
MRLSSWTSPRRDRREQYLGFFDSPTKFLSKNADSEKTSIGKTSNGTKGRKDIMSNGNKDKRNYSRNMNEREINTKDIRSKVIVIELYIMSEFFIYIISLIAIIKVVNPEHYNQEKSASIGLNTDGQSL